jgi:malonyl CoA-acyl carrier protein transacylase
VTVSTGSVGLAGLTGRTAPAGTVLVFEGQGATAVPGEPPVDLIRLAPADAQRAIVAHQLARARACAAAAVAAGDGAPVVGVVGQSLGEISALVAAGVLDEADALELVRLRGELPARLLPAREWTMASMTRLPPARAEDAASGLDVWIVGRNGPADCIVTGASDHFAAFVDRLGVSPQTYRLLPVVAPYHTPVMAPVADALAAAVEVCDLREPAVAVVTPTGPGEVRTAAEAAATLVRALTEPVAWREALLDAAARWPGARWRECGPSASLHRFVWKNGLDLDWDEA